MSQAGRVSAAIWGVNGVSELRLGRLQNLAIGEFGADTVSSPYPKHQTPMAKLNIPGYRIKAHKHNPGTPASNRSTRPPFFALLILPMPGSVRCLEFFFGTASPSYLG